MGYCTHDNVVAERAGSADRFLQNVADGVNHGNEMMTIATCDGCKRNCER